MSDFIQFTLTGNAKSTDKFADSAKFLQGQISANVDKITNDFLPTAICNLKGRILFGLWIKKAENGFDIVIHASLDNDFETHIKKYGAFSKIELTDKKTVYPTVVNDLPTFSLNQADKNAHDWQILSIQTGNYWITKDTKELFQPQELRLHQRGGVDYDKGCYMGQEIVARLWFRASPKAWLHRISFDNFDTLNDKVQVVNSINLDNGFEALVVAKSDDLENLSVQVLNLPTKLQAPVGRQ